MNLNKMGPVLALAATGACGGGTATAPSGRDMVAVVSVGARGGAPAAGLGGLRAGSSVDVAADWTVSSNDVDVYVTGADCLDVTALSVDTCLALAQASGPSAKPERLVFTAAAGASYRVFVVNRGAQADTVTVTIAVR